MIKKIGRYASYLIIPLIIVSLIYWDTIIPFLREVNNGDEGFLLRAYNFVAYYFKDADFFNVLVTLLVAVGIMLGFVGLDVLVTRILNKIKHPFFQFVKKEWFRLIPQRIIVFSFLIGIYIIGSVLMVVTLANNQTKTVETADTRPVLILGTNKHLSYNQEAENVLFTYRIDVAIDLFDAGKAEYFVVSGDKTASRGYDETLDMKRDLMARGVPEKLILRDTAGYRTLDSMLRLRALFGLSKVTIVSQAFHTERALFLASFYGMDAIAVNASGSTLDMVKRELGAKPKMLADLLLFNMQPKASKHQYRETFKVDSNIAVWGALLVFVSVITSLWVLFNLLEQRTSKIGRKITFASLTAIGAVFCLVTVFKTTDIQPVNSLFKAISETTGVLKSTVERKEREVIESQVADKKIAEVRSNIVKQITEAQVEIDSLPVEVETLLPDKEKISFTTVKVNPDVEQRSKKEEDLPEEEKPTKSAFSTIVGGNNSSGFPGGSSKNTSGFSNSKKEIYVKIHGTQSASNNSSIKLRLAKAVTINGESYPENHVFSGTILLQDNGVQVKFNINGTQGYLVNEENKDELSRTAYSMKNDQLIVSSSAELKAFII